MPYKWAWSERGLEPARGTKAEKAKDLRTALLGCRELLRCCAMLAQVQARRAELDDGRIPLELIDRIIAEGDAAQLCGPSGGPTGLLGVNGDI